MGAIRYLKCSPSMGGPDPKQVLSTGGAFYTPSPGSDSDSTPSKRRRLLIKGSPQAELQEAALKFPAADAKLEREERMNRMLICNTARCVIRDLLCGKRAIGISEEIRVRAQVVACHAVQSYSASTLIRNESPDGIAIAAALASLKTVGIDTNAEEVVSTFNAKRLVDGLPEFGDSDGPLEGLRSAVEIVLELETRLSPCIWTLDSVATLPLDYVETLVAGVGGRLPENPTFISWCNGRDAHAQATLWSKQLATTTRCFVADAVMCPTSLLTTRPKVTAAAALALAAQFMLCRVGRCSSRSELVNLLEDLGATHGLLRMELEQAIDEILNVFRLWKEARSELNSACKSA